MNTLRWRWRRIRDRWQASRTAWMATFAVGLASCIALALATGAVAVPLAELPSALTRADDPMHPAIWYVRAPRVAGAVLVGAALAVSGALLQTVVRNPLADPGILGVTASAGVAALIAIVLFPEHAALVPVVAFAGGLVAIGIIVLSSWLSSRRLVPQRIILTGVALQALFFAAIALITFFFADRAPAFAAFTVGSLNGIGWDDAAIAAVPIVLGIALATLWLRPLNVLLLDEGSAAGVGLAVQRTRLSVSCIAALLASGAVSVAGLVGFVGLVVPNAVRLLAGPDHRILLPLTALGGATLVVGADTVARSAAAPLELPVGALLAFLGAPYLLFLLWRQLP